MRCTLALLALPVLFACGDDPEPLAPDASTNRPDAGDAGAGAGPDAGPDAGSGFDHEGCRILTLHDRDLEFNIFSQLTGLKYTVSPNLDGDRRDYFLLELYDSTTMENFPALLPGTFDLATGLNTDLATCQHCLWLRVDETASGTVAGIYYQTEGTITLERVSDPFEPVFKGSTGRVVLRRATVDDQGHSVLEPDGDCVSIANIQFDTSTRTGAGCESAEDCGNPLLEICDPATNTCGEPQCGEFNSCPGNDQICISQYRDLFYGGCYRSCDPTATQSSQCEDAQRCVQFGVDPAFGVCRYVGGGAEGSACTPEDNSTACAGEAVCSDVSRTCSLSCTYFDEATGCSNGRVCSLFGVCEPVSSGRNVDFGEPCAETDELATGCAPDGQAFRGICFAYPPEAPICEKACLGSEGCDAGEFCALRFSSGLGICLPNPVCGDGELGEIDETCDDGNMMSGDGCSSDCRSVEYEVICSTLPALPFGVAVEGDTSTARDGFQSSCQLGIARASVYSVTTTTAGRLALRISSLTQQTVAVRTGCDDPGSELGCAELDFGAENHTLTVQVTSTSGADLTAIVSAFTVLEQGPFSLRADFVPERCGDNILAGNEVCDDGNRNSHDGCRADCRLVEYDFYCANAPALSTTMPNAGDTTGAPPLFLNQCSEKNGIASSGDRLYRFTAPSNGNLHLQLDSTENLVIAVMDGCGTPAQVTQLDCNTVFTIGDLDVPLTGGQTVTVYVDGFLPRDFGPYSLSATFTPN